MPARRGSPRSAGIFLAALVCALLLGFWLWNSGSARFTTKGKSNAPTQSADAKGVFEKLAGRWQRPDGGYVLSIGNIAENGTIDASYFNPKPIHVSKAEASYDAEATKVLIELRDVNYPGSTYTLTYEPISDQLQGLYYQAVENQRFAVVFKRME
jgi:hypothetical protein